MTCLKPLEREKRRPGGGDYSGLECGSGRTQREREGGGNKGDIDSVAPTTALAGDQVKEGGRAPADCSRKRKEQRQRGRERDIGRLREKGSDKSTKKAEIPSCKQQTKGLCHQQLPAFDVYCI